MRRIISILMENEPGALSRVVGLFAGRGFALRPPGHVQLAKQHHSAALAILEHALLPIWSAGVNAECFLVSRIRIDAEGAVAHTKKAILAGEFLQTVGDINVSARRAVLRAQDGVLTGIAGRIAKRLEAEDLPQNGIKHAIRAVRIAPVLVTAAIAVLVAATEALAEIVVVVVPFYVITVVAVVCVLIPIRILVVGTPAILAVRPSSPESFLVTVVNGLPEIICGVLINLVVAVATLVPINRSRVKVRIAIVVGMTAHHHLAGAAMIELVTANHGYIGTIAPSDFTCRIGRRGIDNE